MPKPGDIVDDAEVVRNQDLAVLVPHLTYDQPQLVILPGKRGNGKTYAEEQYIEVREPRVLVITPRSDDFQRVPRTDLDTALWELDQGGPCRRRVALELDAVDFEELEDPKNLAINTYDFGAEVFAKCARQLRGCLLVLSEVHLWSPYKAPAIVTLLVTQSRHWGIRLMVDSQRIGLVPDIFLSEATEAGIFRIGRRPRDQAVIEEWFGSEIAEYSRKIAKRQCLLIRDV